MAEQGLKDKTVKGVAWSGIDNVAQYGISFVVGIILARLLSPEDYGLIGLTAIFSTISTALINGGFGTALIRKVDAVEDDYNTVFIVNLGMSLLLYLILFLCAPWIASFFGRDELISLIRVTSLGLIIVALSVVQQVRLMKAIDFKSQTRISVIAVLTSGALGISMAFMGFGVWSLVFQHLTNTFLKTTLLWINNKWIPKLRFSIKSFKELFGFGWKLMVSWLLDSIWKELYQVVVGKFYSPATLGQYTRAKGYSQLLSSNLTTVIQRVTYPVLSTIQNDKVKMVAAYKRIIKTTMFVTAISMLFLGAISEPLIYCLIGPKWHEASTYLPIICLIGSVYPLQAINLNMLEVQGRSDLFLGLEVVKKIIAMGPLCVGAFIGIMPMLYTSIITTIIAYFLNSHYSGKFLGYSSWMQLKDIAPSYTIAFFIAVSVYFLKYLPFTYWFILSIQLVVGCIVFFALCHIFSMEEYGELKNLLLPYLRKVRIK